MPKRKRRGRPKGSSVQKKVIKKSADSVQKKVIESADSVQKKLIESVDCDQKKVIDNADGFHKKVIESADSVQKKVIDSTDSVQKKVIESEDSVQKKVIESADGEELVILDNPSNVLDVDPDFRKKQEADTVMPKRKGRGWTKGSSVQKKVIDSADSKELVILDNPSNVLDIDPESREEQQDTDMPKKKGRGWPKGSSVQKVVIEGVDSDELVILDNPSNVLDIDPEFREEQEADTDMPKKKGQGRPKRSTAQNFQESVHRNLNGHINPSSKVEVGPGCEESEGADVVNTPMQRGEGQLRESMNQKNHRQNADENISVRPMTMGRGPTKGLIVQMKHQQSADGKLDVLIHPTKLVAVGPGRKDFITDLSLIVRQNARLNVRQWKRVPQNTRNAIVQKVLDNWRLPDTDMVRKAILDEAGRLYRNWRNRLHDYYLMFESKEEALKHVPDDVNDSDWKIMVDYFSSPSFQIISMKNKANRAKQQMHHTCGQKSFIAVSYDARDPVTGKEPDLQTLWHLTHKRANGEWIDQASKEVNDKVVEQINEKRCQLENSQDDMETIEPEIINTAVKTVVGKKSILQDFSADLRSSRSIKVQRLQAELDAQKREKENARKESNEIRAKLIEVESQLEEELRKREEIEAHRLDRQKEVQEIINSQVQTAIQSALSQYRPLTIEAETSSKHKRKIAALEAQLRDAEDVITDIRSELIKYRIP